MTRAKLHRICALLLLSAIAATPHTLHAQRADAPEVLLRLDDIGMNHSVNLAMEKVAATGMPFSVSLLFACPWYQEAVEILKKYPHVTVGVHLALNSEWRNYRWGPVLGKAGAPSLVDSVGYFLPSRDAFLSSKYDLGEVERELSAQVERALRSGLRITYVDAHMGMAEATPQLREVEERVAKRYGLAISTYFGESYFSLWGVPVASKKSELLAYLANAKRDSVNLIEVHVAERTPEMEVIFDMNAPSQNTPEAGVVAHRKAELETMLSPELAQMVRSGKIRLVTYQQLVARKGVAGMRRPASEAPAADSVAVVKRELAARYAENEAGFFARDADRVMRLRHPAFHTITPDGKVSTREQMYQRTRAFIGRIERFDSLSETITALTLAGDTAHAIVDQRTVRQQRFPDGALHQVRTSVVQRESWIKTPQGWLLWRVDEIKPGQTLVDGRPPPT
jgi:predicted glycoside hydrolase/deacetylase ChbG (UPF0249 family)